MSVEGGSGGCEVVRDARCECGGYGGRVVMEIQGVFRAGLA